MTFSFSQRSLKNLFGLHPDLVRVAHDALAMSPLDFGIIEGVRTGERQHELFQLGKTQLDWPGKPGEPQGRHLTGHAFDYIVYVDGVATETDIDAYVKVADAFKAAAASRNVAIHYGGDNPHWKDNDHIELDRVAYPDEPLVA